MLLALSASPDELEVVMLSVTYGNVELQRYVLGAVLLGLGFSNSTYSRCLRNVVALFHVLEKEIAWRESKGSRGSSYGALTAFKPIVAVGADHPLEDEMLMADHFRELILVCRHLASPLTPLQMAPMACTASTMQSVMLSFTK
jgi:hypothetical protein